MIIWANIYYLICFNKRLISLSGTTNLNMKYRVKIIFSIIIVGFLLLYIQPICSFSQTTFKMPTRPYGAVIVDYDLDGDNDVIVGCHAISSSDPDSIVIMFNDGWGNFEQQGFETKNGIFIYCKDMTNDGYPDIISRDGDSIFFLENNKQGGLGDLFNICHTIGNRRIGGIADMDTNGYLDIVYYGIQVIRGWGIAYNLDGYNFNDDYSYYTENNEYISIGCLDEDTIVDVLVSNRSSPSSAYVMYNRINTFQKELISSQHWAHTYVFDVNNDNQNEAVFEFHSSLHYVDAWLYFFERESDTNYTLIDSSALHGGSNFGAFDDFDKDGYLDFAVTVSSWVTDPSEDSIYVYRNNQNWGYELHHKHYIGGWFYSSIISGDLNMDGFPDAVTIGYLNPNADYIQLLWNDRKGHFIDTNSVYVIQFEQDFRNAVKLFPNPVDKNLTISSNLYGIKEFFLYDMHGRLIVNRFYSNFEKKISINLIPGNCNPGFYLCCIKLENNKTVYKKIIINQTF